MYIREMNKAENECWLEWAVALTVPRYMSDVERAGFRVIGPDVGVGRKSRWKPASLLRIWALNIMWQMSVRLSGRLSFRTLSMNTGRAYPQSLCDVQSLFKFRILTGGRINWITRYIATGHYTVWKNRIGKYI